MPQTSFGRRNASPQAGLPSATVSSCAEGSSRAVVLSSAAASFVAFAALGYFLTPGGMTRQDTVALAPTISHVRPAPAECRKPDCKNEYSVELRCGEADQPKSTRVVASSAEAATMTAERYNRGCRARRAVFVALLTPGASGTSKAAAPATDRKATGTARSSRVGRRMRRR